MYGAISTKTVRTYWKLSWIIIDFEEESEACFSICGIVFLRPRPEQARPNQIVVNREISFLSLSLSFSLPRRVSVVHTHTHSHQLLYLLSSPPPQNTTEREKTSILHATSSPSPTLSSSVCADFLCVHFSLRYYSVVCVCVPVHVLRV